MWCMACLAKHWIGCGPNGRSCCTCVKALLEKTAFGTGPSSNTIRQQSLWLSDTGCPLFASGKFIRLLLITGRTRPPETFPHPWKGAFPVPLLLATLAAAGLFSDAIDDRMQLCPIIFAVGIVYKRFMVFSIRTSLGAITLLLQHSLLFKCCKVHGSSLLQVCQWYPCKTSLRQGVGLSPRPSSQSLSLAHTQSCTHLVSQPLRRSCVPGECPMRSFSANVRYTRAPHPIPLGTHDCFDVLSCLMYIRT